MKKKVIIILISLILMVTGIDIINKQNIYQLKTSENSKEKIAKSITVDDGMIFYADELMKEDADGKHEGENTLYLQNLINEVSKIGGATIKLPAGTYYFGLAKNSKTYAILCKDDVKIVGAGTNLSKENKNTTIIPYVTEEELKVAGRDKGSMDMFYYNKYASNFTNTKYLNNADFKDFIIDGQYLPMVNGRYTSNGKGFMINLYENCDWENVVVKNTIGTGFGMDCPINCTIKNCIADNCGRGATTSEGGASGFGIGTGYSNSESIYIYNCEATNCRKYGFFFEHQGKFKELEKSYIYPAQKSCGFVVANCIASGNTYDFGGERAYDVTYENCTSKLENNSEKFGENTNLSAFHFQEHSIRCNIVNCTVEKQFNDFTDSSQYYYEPAYWALKNGMIDTEWDFTPNEKLTRGKTILYLHRINGIPGDTIVYNRNNAIINEQLSTGFDDVLGSSIYANAVIWAKKQGIIKGTSNSNFNPDSICNREQAIIMLYRYAGSPEIEIDDNPFTDVSGKELTKAVTWAKNVGIVKGTNGSTFSPSNACTKAMLITWLYRMDKANIIKEYNITYNLLDGIDNDLNPVTYIAGTSDVTLIKPTKTGYIFNGWTGSNVKTQGYTTTGYIPSENVKITTNDRGNKIFSANWTPIRYTVKFNANGGVGEMQEEVFTYDEPKVLLTNCFTKKCDTFEEWNTNKDGNGISYSNESVIKNITSTSNETITLYAQWKGVTHTWNSGQVTQEPTCEKIGKKIYTCIVCGETKTETIPTIGHKEVIDKGIEATCTKDGLTEGKHCSRCEKILIKQNVIPALGHIEVVDKGIEPTCTESGLTEGKHCSRCNEVLIAQEEIEALGHRYEKGVCIKCGEKETTIEVESAKYEVGEYIAKIKAGTTAKELITNIQTNANLKIYSKDNKEIGKEGKIATGMKIEFTLGNEKIIYSLVVIGDLNGDGQVGDIDLLRLARYKVGLDTNLTGEYLQAADLNGNKNLADDIDLLMMARTLVGLYSL